MIEEIRQMTAIVIQENQENQTKDRNKERKENHRFR